jgi:putative aldouronate transport system substrate-binding protein
MEECTVKRISKPLVLILAIVLCVGIFAECVSGRDANGGKPITINWLPQNDSPVNPDSPVVKELEKALNVKLNFIYLERSKEVELLNIRLASGEIPDVMKLTDDRFRAYIAQGVLADIPESLVKKKAPKLYAMTMKNGGSNIWEFPKENGKLYGLPILNPDGGYQFVPIWRNDWLKNVGINKIPGTLAEAETAFYKFVNDDPDKNGKKDTYALSNTGMSVIFGAFGGVPYFSKGGGLGFTWSLVNGKVMATAVMPQMKEALTLLHKWYKDGLIDPEFISEENKGQYWGNSVTFWNGKIGFSCPGMGYHVSKPAFAGDPGSQNWINWIKLQPNSSYDFGRPLTGPQGKAGTERWGSFPGTYLVFGRQVASDPKKLEKILEINEKLITDDKINTLAGWGIPNLTYKVQPNGLKTFIGDLVNNSKAATFGLSNNGIFYMGTNNFERYKKDFPYRYSLMDKVGNYTPGYQNAVWAGLPSYPMLKPAIEKKIRESYMLFITGDKKIEDFDNFVEDLNKSGLDQLTKEANDWYHKYHKK